MLNSKANIFFCGDPHGQFGHIVNAALNLSPDAVVLLGDITPEKPITDILAPVLDVCPVYWILGNHDTDRDVYHDNLFECVHPRLHYIGGKVVRIIAKNGEFISLAGLDGIFRKKIWMPERTDSYCVSDGPCVSRDEYINNIGKGNLWRGGMPLRQRSTIFPDEYKRLSQLSADILVTHEAPSPHEYGFPLLHKLALKMNSKFSFHGHQHQSVDYGYQDGVRARGVGYCDIMDLQGNLISFS